MQAPYTDRLFHAKLHWYTLGNMDAEGAKPALPAWSARLVEAMTESKIRLRALAADMNTSVGTVSHWRTGKREPDLKTLIKLAQAIKKTPEWLLCGHTLSPQEAKLLENFRRSDVRGKSTILIAAQREANCSTKQNST